jgi:hypothetical protein
MWITLEMETKMNDQTLALHSLLVAGGRQLENFKFFPGTRRGVTAEELCEAATVAVKAAQDRGLIDNPPRSVKYAPRS